jgi:hypothetical protein
MHVVNPGPNMTSILDDNVSKLVIQLTHDLKWRQ